MLGPLVIVVLIAAVALVVVASTRGRGLPGRGSRPRRREPATARRPRRTRRRHPHSSTPERVLLAEGEDIQDVVEARLTARGVAPHRLSGPNPPIPGARVATDGLYRDPRDPALATTYPEPGMVVPPAVLADQAALDEQELRRRRARRSLTGGG